MKKIKSQDAKWADVVAKCGERRSQDNRAMQKLMGEAMARL